MSTVHREVPLLPSVKTYQFAPELKIVGSMSRAKRARTFHQIEAIRRKFEKPVKRNFKTIFTRQRNALLDLDSMDPYDVLKAVHSTDRAMMATLENLYVMISDDIFPMVTDMATVKATWEAFETKADSDESYYRQRMRMWIRSNAGAKITDIDKTTLNEVRNIMEKSESMLEFRKGIEHLFNDSMILNRPSLIARTETVAGTNRASFETIRSFDSAREQVKTWQSVGDNDVRDTHRMLQGVTVPFDGRFEWSGKYGLTQMDIPADSTHGAHVGEIANCRCWFSVSAI